jgi:hypothetical protein
MGMVFRCLNSAADCRSLHHFGVGASRGLCEALLNSDSQASQGETKSLFPEIPFLFRYPIPDSFR